MFVVPRAWPLGREGRPDPYATRPADHPGQYHGAEKPGLYSNELPTRRVLVDGQFALHKVFPESSVVSRLPTTAWPRARIPPGGCFNARTATV